jgi:chemotaxis protein histidine kinase CheA
MGLAGTFAAQAAQKAIKEAAEKAAKEAAQKAIKEAAEKATKEAAQKAAKEAAQKAIKEAAEKATKEAAAKAGKEAAEKATKEAAAKAGKEAAEKATKEAAEKATKEATEKASKEAAEKGSKAASEKASKEAAEKASKAASEKASKEAAEKASKEAAEKASKEAAEKGMKTATKLKAAAALGLVGAAGAYIVYDAKKQADKINNAVLNIKKIEKSPDNPGNIRITYDPPLLLSEDDKALFKNTNSMPNLSPVNVDITYVIDPSTIEIKGTLTSAGTTGAMEPETTFANQAKLGAKQKAAALANAAADAAGAGIGAGISFIEKMLGLPPGTIKNIGYGILILIVLYVVYKIYGVVKIFFFKPKSAFGKRQIKGGKFSFGKLFGFGKKR